MLQLLELSRNVKTFQQLESKERWALCIRRKDKSLPIVVYCYEVTTKFQLLLSLVNANLDEKEDVRQKWSESTIDYISLNQIFKNEQGI